MSNEELAIEIRTGKTELQSTLWMQIKGFIIQEAARFYFKCPGIGGVEIEDLVQSAYFAMLSAIDAFEENSGYKFLTFLSYHLKTEFCTCAGIRTKKATLDPLNCKPKSFDEPLSSSEDSRIYADVLPDPEDCIEAANQKLWLEQVRAALDDMLLQLPEEQAETMRNRYYGELTVEDTARKMQLSAAEVKRNESKAMKRLRGERQKLEAFIDDRTPFYKGVSISTFSATHTSAVEKLIFTRERLRGELENGKH